eukprot:3932785-Pleurochrysis_carterae.AAC.7
MRDGIRALINRLARVSYWHKQIIAHLGAFSMNFELHANATLRAAADTQVSDALTVGPSGPFWCLAAPERAAPQAAAADATIRRAHRSA